VHPEPVEGLVEWDAKNAKIINFFFLGVPCAFAVPYGRLAFNWFICKNYKFTIRVTIMTTPYIGVIRKGRVEFETPVALPEGSQVVVFLTKLDERTARRIANTWLAEHVGNVVGTEKQGVLLQTGNQAIWRFEAFVTGVTYKIPLGPLGQINIDANTGQALNDQQLAQELIKRATELAPLS
jgi:hypothetical protein